MNITKLIKAIENNLESSEISMGYINILTYSAKDIRIKNRQLVLDNGLETMEYPLEDINSVLIESQNCLISVKTLTELAKRNITTYFCDEKHLPSAYLLNYNGFYKNLEVYNYQTGISKPTQKQLWKQIVTAKIENQLKVLDLCGIKHNLKEYVAKIKSADTDNIEAIVANQYFKLLFGNKFTRQNENLINASLNYGYAIVRGSIARTVVAHGLLPFLGVFHHNKLNAFNLVDDLIEPFRPLVDLFVIQNILCLEENSLTPSIKQTIFGLINYDMLIQNQHQNLSNAIEIFVNSFVDSITDNVAKLSCPQLIPLHIHQYE